MIEKSSKDSQENANRTIPTTTNFVFVTNSDPKEPDQMIENVIDKSPYIEKDKVAEIAPGISTSEGIVIEHLESQQLENDVYARTSSSHVNDTDGVTAGVAVPDAVLSDVFVPDEVQRSQSNFRTSRGPGAYSLAPGRDSLIVSSRTNPRRTSAESLYSFHSDREVIATAVTDAEPVVYASDVKKEERSRFSCYVGGVLFFSTVIGLSLGLGMGIKKQSPPDIFPPQNFAKTPWRDCDIENQEIESERRTKLKSILKLKFGEEYNTPCSSQNQALTWLAEDDGFLVPETFAYIDKIIQRFAVAHFFFSTNGPGWINKFDWLSEEDECLWDGVSCDNNENVITMNIPSKNNATGTIPPTIGSLSSLNGLVFSKNKIGGKIPTEIGFLRNLEVFTASGNKISGTIPVVIGDMKNLRIFDIGGNQLTGPIPSSLYALRNLHVIVLHNNLLNGTISSEIRNLSRLRHVMMGRNNFSGKVPSDIQQLDKLRFLDISGNDFSGQIPSEMGSMKNLTCLGLSNNTFHGQIPKQLGNLKNLEHLKLGGNDFNTSVPDGVCYHFRNNALPGARICEGKNLNCSCCSLCEASNRPFCMPGVELRKPPRNPPMKKPPNI